MKPPTGSKRQPLPLGWMPGPEGELVPEPVDTPIGDEPPFRAWIRCRGTAADGSRCRLRVEILFFETLSAAVDVVREIPGALLCAGCQRRAAPQPQAREPAPPPPAPPSLLPVYVRDLIRSGRAPSKTDPRGSTWAWTKAQDELRALFVASPAAFFSALPEALAELRQLPGWLPYWTAFLSRYRLDLHAARTP